MPKQARFGNIAIMRMGFSKLAFLHPALFALLPAISLLSHNINEAPIFHAVRPAAAAVFGASIMLLLLARITRDWEEAALLTSLTLMLFFSYGHVYFGLVYEETGTLFDQLGLAGQHGRLVIVWTAIFALGAYAIHRVKQLRRTVTQLFVLMAFAALVPPLVRIVSHEIQLSQPWDPTGEDLQSEAATKPGTTPDIYFVVLDGYARSDVLETTFAYDNSAFEDFLVEQGFFIATQSRSNYTQTGLSMASTLNMKYLDSLSAEPGRESDDRTPIARLIRWSAVRKFLVMHGYSIFGLSTGYRITSLENVDEYLREPFGATTTLERLVIETSGLVLVQDLAARLGVSLALPGYAAHRERIGFALDTLMNLPASSGPKFVFAHILVPHPPFVFLADGEPAEQEHPFTLMDGDAFLGTEAEYIEGYRQQISYVDRVMKEVILEILANSQDPPVILVQADHGSGLGLNWQSAEASDLWERTAILNAYYLPGVPAERLYAEISPVNSFRLVFDSYFGTDLGFLEDASYYSTWKHPYDFALARP